jgi:hypothetical protein
MDMTVVHAEDGVVVHKASVDTLAPNADLHQREDR